MSVVAKMGPRKWHVPARDGQTLVAPPLAALLPHLGTPRPQPAVAERLDGVTWETLCQSARQALIEAALAYTRSYLDVPEAPDPTRPLVLAGHQPELVHPGVWFKHFVLQEAARRGQAVAVHVLIDSDVPRASGIAVPVPHGDRPALEHVPFDRPVPDVPYEHRSIRDADCFHSFGRRVAPLIAPWIADPIIGRFWPIAQAHAHRPLGQALSIARHVLERTTTAGGNLEVPLSRLAATEGFAWFLGLALTDPGGLHRAYNAALAAFRRQHRIRSPGRPVPMLESGAGGWELPFWVWTPDDPRRRRLWVRLAGRTIEATDRHHLTFRLDARPPQVDQRLVEQIQQLERRGIQLRPRALATTLFLRWIPGDLFVHGIGGAHYDGVTEEWARRWWGADAPPFLVATATFRLPLPVPAVTREDLTRIRVQLRDLAFHPEQWLDATPDTRPWIEQKKAAIAEALPKGRRAARHRRIVEANRHLAALLEPTRQKLHAQYNTLLAQWRTRQMLHTRTFSMVLFPETLVRRLGERVAEQ